MVRYSSAGEVGIEIRLFGYVADALLVGNEVFVDGLAVEEDLTGSHFDETGDHLHGGGFAGAVGTEITGDFAGVGGEADVIDGGDAGEVFGDVRSSSI